jgi:hypothetical protein
MNLAMREREMPAVRLSVSAAFFLFSQILDIFLRALDTV